MTRVLALLSIASLAHATPSPDTVVIIANASSPGSMMLARRYADVRDVPDRQICALELPSTADITLDQYRSLVLEPLRACLDAGGIRDRIEAAVVMRGVPLRVLIPIAEGGAQSVSLAAA